MHPVKINLKNRTKIGFKYRCKGFNKYLQEWSIKGDISTLMTSQQNSRDDWANRTLTEDAMSSLF